MLGSAAKLDSIEARGCQPQRDPHGPRQPGSISTVGKLPPLSIRAIED